MSETFPGLDFSYVRQNVSRSPGMAYEEQIARMDQELGEELMAELRRRNALDLKLYETMTRELETRIAEVPDFAGRLDTFRERCRAREDAPVPVVEQIRRAVRAGRAR